MDKTPEVFAISDTPRILIPEGGYSKDRNGEYSVEENVEDIYLLLCEGNAKKLRKLYVDLTGRSELVRLSTLGSWNSKYYAYTEEEAKQVILDYEAHGVSLDNMVIDTDWRDGNDGWGYDVNMELFPDMKRFLEFAHAHGVEIMFNDHPEPVEGIHVFESKEIAYRRITVNGEEVAFKVVKKDVSAFPLNTDETAPDSDTLLVNMLAHVEKDYEIKFYL